jgi:hypothetical protein
MGKRSITDLLPGLTYKGATGHVFRLVHGSNKAWLAWHPTRNWVLFAEGKIYTYADAVSATIKDNLPEAGRWYAIGKLIYSVE